MNKKLTTIAGAVIVILILVTRITAPDKPEQPVSISQAASAGQQVTTASAEQQGTVGEPDPVGEQGTVGEPESEENAGSAGESDPGESANETGSPFVATGSEGISPGGQINARVKRIVDGDTLKVEYKGEEYRVRLLCIDTPETVKEGVDEQPYGKLAAEKLTEMLLNEEVTMVFDKDIDDRYGRLLAYILLEDGACANIVMVEQGFARIDIVKPNNTHADYFNKLQKKAIKERKGLWSLPVEDRPFIKNEKGIYVPRFYENEAA